MDVISTHPSILHPQYVSVLQVMVTDIALGAGTTTDPLPVIQFLKASGVKVMVDDAVSSLIVTQVIFY